MIDAEPIKEYAVPKVDDTPKTLKPYTCHGLDLQWRAGDDQATTDCPFCGRDRKFSVNVETGLYRCFVCDGKGNAYTFLRALHELGYGTTSEAQYADLSTDRKLLEWGTLAAWGVVKSPLTGEWLVPGYGPDGGLNNLYRYSSNKPGGKRLLMGTAEVHHQLFGVPLYDPNKQDVMVAEGPWDAMALWEVLGRCKRAGDGRLVPTGNPEASLLASTNVLAVPGCNSFAEVWAGTPLFAGKRVSLLFDSDHPRENPKGSGKLTEPAGYAGARRAAGLLLGAAERPESVGCFNWGDGGYNPVFKSGYDVRDWLTEGKGDAPSRVTTLTGLLAGIEPVPDEWAEGVKAAGKGGGVKVTPLECTEWKVLIRAWRKALRWTDGLDCGFSFMLAVIASTKAQGDQLWGRLLSPPSCLDGDTPIYDPVTNTTLTVRERYEVGEPFHVYSRGVDGKVVVTPADPPRQFPRSQMFRVVFASGGAMRVTAGHRFWYGGESYVTPNDVTRDYFHHGMIPLLPFQENMKAGLSADTFGDNPVVSVRPDGEDVYYDFHVPKTENYWACGFFHHNTGKSTLCEAVSVADKYVVAKSTLRGFLSGDGDETTDCSLINQLKDKTFVLKDGDTLLTQENLPQILAEARDLFDTNIRSSYRKKGVSRDYNGVRMTWLLCGTASLRTLDTSELGERFLTCSIMDDIDDDLEDEILWRTVNRANRSLAFETSGDASSQQDADMTLAMRLTGGYVEYLRRNANRLLAEVSMNFPEEHLRSVARMAKFVAFMRARPSVKQDEVTDREMASRLASQMTRLPACLAVVLNRREVDAEVMRRTAKVMVDTARGRSLEVARYLYECGDKGAEQKAVSVRCNSTPEKKGILLRFLRKIKVVDVYQDSITPGVKGAFRWRLTPKFRRLYADVMTDTTVGDE